MSAYLNNLALHMVTTTEAGHRRLHHERARLRLRDLLGMALILVVFPVVGLWALALWGLA